MKLHSLWTMLGGIALAFAVSAAAGNTHAAETPDWLKGPLKKPLDQALTTITASPEWRSVEESYFGQ